MIFSTMSGEVTDINGGLGIENATVRLTEGVVNTTTNSTGDYLFADLPFGTYQFEISAEGYEPQTVEVTLSETNQTVNFSLGQLLELEITGAIYGDNNISEPLENVTLNLYLDGNLEETVYSNQSGEFIFPLVFGTFNYELEVVLYGYYAQMIGVNPIDSDIDLGDIILEEEFISPYNVVVDSDGGDPRVTWGSPKRSKQEKLAHDSGSVSNSFTNEPNENVWLGNYFNFEEPTTLNSVEIQTDIYQNATDFVTIDVIDLVNDTVLVTSEPFLILQNTEQTIDIPNITVTGLIGVMIHWQDNPASTNSLAIEFSEEGMFDGAVIKFPGEFATLFSSFIGAPEGFSSAFLLRVNTLTEDDPVTNGEEVSYNIYRGLEGSFPDVSGWDLLNGSSVEGIEFEDSVPGADPAETYRYAVEAIYANGFSEVTFSNTISGALLGIDDVEISSSDFKLFPNPAADVINMHFPESVSLDGPIEFYDLLGKRVLLVESENYSNMQQVNISSLNSGVYIVKCYLDNGDSLNKKLIVR